MLVRSDPRARAIERHLPLVRSIAHRFAGRGESYEDLVQVGNLALVGAVDRCERGRERQLTAYVAACVEGALRRHLRDRCAPLRVPRRLQSEPALMASLRSPVAVDDEAQALAAPEDLDELGIARVFVAEAARTLDRRERRVLALRYFLDLSQREIGDTMGISQVHVGRVLARALGKMRLNVEQE